MAIDKWQAQDQFWNSFGLPAFDENTDIDYEKELPSFNHITYQAMAGVIGQDLPLTASLWYMSDSWAEISRKADEILEAIYRGVVIKVEGGYVWLKTPIGTPFAQRMEAGDSGHSIKRIYLNIEAECLTEK